MAGGPKTRKGRCCEKCGGKRTYTPGPGSRWSKHRPKSDKTHTLCDKCWKSLRTSNAPKSKSYTATRPGRPISELESIFDPGPCRETEPWETLANKVLIALGFLPYDLLSQKQRWLARKAAHETPENTPTEIPEVGT
jgi:hypothetical protein